MKLTTMKAYILYLMLFSLAACNPATVEEYSAEATAFLDQGKQESATIALKNGIQKYPNNAELRLALGELYLIRGETFSAIKELEKTIKLDLKYKDSVIPKIFEAFVVGNLYEEPLAFAKNNNVEWCTSCQLSLAWANINLGESPLSIKLPSSASDEHIWMLQLIKMVHANEFSKVITSLQDNRSKFQQYSINHQIIVGILATQFGLNELSLELMEPILATRKYLIWLRIPIAQTLIASKRFDDAEKYIDLILSVDKSHGFANFLKSTILVRNGDYIATSKNAENAINNGYDTAQSRLILGISQYKLEQYERALSNLNSAAARLPDAHFAHQMLIATQIKLGDTDKIAESILSKDIVNLLDVPLIGQALLKSEGNHPQFKKFLDEASEQYSESLPAIKQQSLLLDLLDGDDSVIQELKNSLGETKTDKTLSLAFALNAIKNGQIEQAISYLQEAIVLAPEDVKLLNYLGAAYYSIGDLRQAEDTYNKALSLTSQNAPSLYFNTMKKITSRDYIGAHKAAIDLLGMHPTHLDILKTLILLNKKLGKPLDQAIEYANLASKHPTSNYLHQLVLANLYIEAKSTLLAEKVIKEIRNKEAWKNTQFWEVKHYLAATKGDEKELRENFRSWKQAIPDSIQSYYRYASYLAANSKFLEAAEILEEIPDNHIDAHSVRITEFYMWIRAQEFKKAKVLLESIEIKDKGKSNIALLNSIYQKALGNDAEAILVLEKWYLSNKSEYSIMMLANLKKQLHKNYVDDLKEHLDEFPQHMQVVNMLAEAYIATDLISSEKYYQIYLNNGPNDAVAVNNYAWVLFQLGQLDKAETQAQNAVSLESENIEFLDTYANILLALKKFSHIETLLSDRYKRSTALTLVYSEALILNGNKQKAVKVLEAAEQNITKEQMERYKALSIQAKS